MHGGGGTVRVMKICGMMGDVVGKTLDASIEMRLEVPSAVRPATPQAPPQ